VYARGEVFVLIIKPSAYPQVIGVNFKGMDAMGFQPSFSASDCTDVGHSPLQSFLLVVPPAKIVDDEHSWGSYVNAFQQTHDRKTLTRQGIYLPLLGALRPPSTSSFAG
jgi:hypothetical protein